MNSVYFTFHILWIKWLILLFLFFFVCLFGFCDCQVLIPRTTRFMFLNLFKNNTRIRPHPRTPAGTPANPKTTPARATSRLTVDTSPSAPVDPIPQDHPQLCSRRPPAISFPSSTPSPKDHKDLLCHLSFPMSSHFPSLQHQQVYPGNTQAEQVR